MPTIICQREWSKAETVVDKLPGKHYSQQYKLATSGHYQDYGSKCGICDTP